MAFNSQAYLAANPDVMSGFNQQDIYKTPEEYAQFHYQRYGQAEGRPLGPPQQSLPEYDPLGMQNLGAQLAANPGQIINGDLALSNQVPTIDPNAPGTNINPNDPRYAQANGPNGQVTTVDNVAQAGQVNQKPTSTYEAEKTQQAVQNAAMEGAQGTVSNNAQIDADKLTIDTDKVAAGEGALGNALNQSAQQNISNIIDTSTLAGKMLAEQLGEGNYTDSKATVKGQLDILSAEFVDANGDPQIPTWAAGTARNVSKIAAFSGMTGTAATAAMTQAIMEAAIPIAQADAAFFQTLTVKNLDNRQQSVINNAQVLANLELANMDARTTAAVNNANAFLQMDMANLNNEQQARVINTQARVQSILEDAKAVNAQRLFTAQSENDMNMFYDQLNAQIGQFNANQANSMAQFNASERNAMSQFNAQLENQRQEFYKNMQFNIDTANAKWRQTVTLSEAQMKFDAAATDVKNKIGLSVEMLNQLWDRSDALLDYAWKSSENALDRQNNIAVASMNNKAAADRQNAQNKANNQAGVGQAVGTVMGAWAGSSSGSSAISNAFSFLPF